METSGDRPTKRRKGKFIFAAEGKDVGLIEKEILDILESGSEGHEAQEIAKSIRAAQATIKENPDTASKRFDELAAVGEYDIHGFIEAGRLKS